MNVEKAFHKFHLSNAHEMISMRTIVIQFGRINNNFPDKKVKCQIKNTFRDGDSNVTFSCVYIITSHSKTFTKLLWKIGFTLKTHSLTYSGIDWYVFHQTTVHRITFDISHIITEKPDLGCALVCVEYFNVSFEMNHFDKFKVKRWFFHGFECEMT